MNEPETRPESTRGERELLRRLRAALPPPALCPGGSAGVPFGDDMAAVDAADAQLLWTTDMLMDGVDFDSRRHGWRAIGRKAMSVNLSDCAAMAARPVAALCAVALQDRLAMDDALELFAGVREQGARFGCPVVGGDTNSWAAPTAIAVTVAARAAGRPVLRSGAQPGDVLHVSGALGGSILGRHLTFEPRVKLAAALVDHVRPRAMIDISDGLAVDLGHLLDESGCAAELDDELLEAAVHEDARRLAAEDGRSAVEHALTDGEDFELLAALPPDAPAEALAALGMLRLGRVVPGAGEIWRCGRDGRRAQLARRGWEHFR